MAGWTVGRMDRGQGFMVATDDERRLKNHGQVHGSFLAHAAHIERGLKNRSSPQEPWSGLEPGRNRAKSRTVVGIWAPRDRRCTTSTR